MQVVKKIFAALRRCRLQVSTWSKSVWGVTVVEVFVRPTKEQLKQAADFCGKLSQASTLGFGSQLGAIQLGFVKLTPWAVATGLELLALAVGFYVASSMLIRRS